MNPPVTGDAWCTPPTRFARVCSVVRNFNTVTEDLELVYRTRRFLQVSLPCLHSLLSELSNDVDDAARRPLCWTGDVLACWFSLTMSCQSRPLPKRRPTRSHLVNRKIDRGRTPAVTHERMVLHGPTDISLLAAHARTANSSSRARSI